MIRMAVGRRTRLGPPALAALWLATAATAAHGQGMCSAPSPQAAAPGVTGMTVDSLDPLVRMSPAELEALYLGGCAGPIPVGPARGRALLSPGSKLAPLL